MSSKLSKKPAEPPIDLTEEEIDLTEGDDQFLGDEEDGDESNPFEDFLVNDEGENIANALTNSLARIADQLETQNKILIKMYTQLAKK